MHLQPQQSKSCLFSKPQQFCFSSMTSKQGKSGSLLYQEVFVNRKVPDNSHNNKSTKQKLKYYAWECFTSKANNIVLLVRSVFYCLNDPEPKTTVGYRFPPKQRKSNRHLILKVHSTSSFMRQSLKCLHKKQFFQTRKR